VTVEHENGKGKDVGHRSKESSRLPRRGPLRRVGFSAVGTPEVYTSRAQLPTVARRRRV
jgi:hypothetical protein